MSSRVSVESKIMKNLLVVAGTLSLIIGVIALIVPVFPTSPFVILAALCYLKSSDDLYEWLINHKYLGKYVYNYVTYRAISSKGRFWSLAALWFSLCVSGYFIANIYARLFLLVFGVMYSAHLIRLNTLEHILASPNDFDTNQDK